MAFLGRSTELNRLEKLLSSDKAELAFVRGRRRVGKSWLLSEFRKNHVDEVFYFMGSDDASDRRGREDFAEAWDYFAGTELSDLKQTKLTWQRLFREMIEYAQKKRRHLLLCFDEIQWLCKGQSGFAGKIKEAWVDLEKYQVKIIICGSSRKFFKESVEGDEKLLRGLKTQADIKVAEFTLSEVKNFYFSKWTDEQIILAYMMFGGLPYYLERIESGNFIRSINDTAFLKESIFLEEVDDILGLEFNAAGVKTIKKLLGSLGPDGATVKKIIEKTGLPSTTVYDNIEKLKDYELVFEKVKMNGESSEIKYILKDYFLNFYFQILEPLENKIKTNEHKALIFPGECIGSNTGYYVPNFSGKAFELLICRILESKDSRNSQIFKILNIRDENYEIGTYWSMTTQVDLIVECETGREARILECKWINKENLKPANYIQQVLDKEYEPNKGIETKTYFVAASQEVSASTKEIASKKGVVFIELKDLFDS